MTNLDTSNIVSSTQEVQGLDVEPKVPARFSIVEFVLIALAVTSGAISVLLSEDRRIVVFVVTFIVVLILLLILNRRFLGDYRYTYKLRENQRKAQLYSRLFGNEFADESINIMRGRAIQYCQELIDDYKDTRRNSRNIYYIFQLSTIIFSGVTPILVLLDKVDLNIPWIKWMPVIFPAIASIVSSLSTSFPFQEKWLAANAAVELLEAEQEKFILGVTQAYRFSDIPNNAERKLKVQESVEGFINQINAIHLKQVQLPGSSEAQTQRSTEAQISHQSGSSTVT